MVAGFAEISRPFSSVEQTLFRGSSPHSCLAPFDVLVLRQNLNTMIR